MTLRTVTPKSHLVNGLCCGVQHMHIMKHCSLLSILYEQNLAALQTSGALNKLNSEQMQLHQKLYTF